MNTKRRLKFSEVFVGLGVLCAAVFAVAMIVWISIGRMETVDAGDRQARETLAELDAVDEALLNQEAGLRAYVAAAQPQFLQDYVDGRRDLARALAHLVIVTANEPRQIDRVRRLTRQADAWAGSVALPELALVEAGRANLARTMVRGLNGERQMLALHDALGALRAEENQELVARAEAQARAFVNARWTLVLSALGAVLAAMLLGGRSVWLLVRSRDAAEAANHAKTQFLANMSHEIRTPLNGVSGVAEALAHSGLDPKQLALVDTIRRSAVSVDALLGDLLALSRDDEAEPPEQRAFDLGALARAAAADYRDAAEAKRLDLIVAAPEGAAVWVEGDAQRLGQILHRLLSNAVKFTDRGSVRLAVDALGEGRFRFTVADTGVGFDPAYMAELFEPFIQSDDGATRRYGGAGLGLAIAQRLARSIGARLDGDSLPGMGARFTLEATLPPAQALRSDLPASAAPGAGDAPPPQDEAPFRVLIVDDHPTNRQVLELILDQLGADWKSVENGLEAVTAAATEPFSAILMDIQMPVMDGLTATREIRKAECAEGRPLTPVIIVSANGQPEHVLEGVSAGAQHHLCKPVNAQRLIDALFDVLDEKQRAA